MMEKPSDILDVASDQTQRERDSIIAAHLARKEQSLTPKGQCHFCEETTGVDLVFCDEFCRDDYQYIEKRKKANGK